MGNIIDSWDVFKKRLVAAELEISEANRRAESAEARAHDAEEGKRCADVRAQYAEAEMRKLALHNYELEKKTTALTEPFEEVYYSSSHGGRWMTL
jgi:hypothetical protein